MDQDSCPKIESSAIDSCSQEPETTSLHGEDSSNEFTPTVNFPNQASPIGSASAAKFDTELFDFWRNEDKHLWRKQYLQKSFYLVGFVLYFSFFILVCVGVGLLDLTSTVIVTLLGSTVAEVIGILLVAFNWLYPRASKDEPVKHLSSSND